MFTGIIRETGVINAIDRLGDWTVSVKTRLPLDSLMPGSSICCSGICLTVIETGADFFRVQLSSETVSRTTASRWNTGTRVNLEPALRAGDEIGGHLVAGHVDGTARVIDRKKDGDSMRYCFETPPEYACFLAPKGSVAIDGISLTINEADGPRFWVNVIPHTRLVTTIGECIPGDLVNFEVDMIARYVARIMGK